MKSLLKALIAVVAFTVSGLIKPVISNVTVSQDEVGKVTLLRDRHFDRAGNITAPIQRKQLLENAQLLNANAETKQDEVLFIVEDNLFYEGDNKNTKEFIEETSDYARKHLTANEEDFEEDDAEDIEVTEGSVLDNIASDCLNLGIDVYNAECRQVKYASAVDGSVTGREVVEESERVIESIMSELEEIKKDTESNEEAQIVYDEGVKIVEKAKKSTEDIIKILRDSDMSIQGLLENQEIENPNDTIGLYDTYLVDARILLAWYKNRDRKNCFIVAGGSHLDRILPILEKIGRQTIEFGKEYPMNKKGTQAMIHNRVNFNEFFKDVYPSMGIVGNESLVPAVA
jgi:phage FluMu protein gp41